MRSRLHPTDPLTCRARRKASQSADPLAARPCRANGAGVSQNRDPRRDQPKPTANDQRLRHAATTVDTPAGYLRLRVAIRERGRAVPPVDATAIARRFRYARATAA